MTPRDADLPSMLDDLANALQTAVLLAERLAGSLRADAGDAATLNEAISRATAALHKLRAAGGAR